MTQSPIALFDRRVKVTVDTIEFDALDCEFKIEKSIKPEPNTCDLVIYNLTQDHQAQLEQLGQRPKGKSLSGVAGAKTTKAQKAALATKGIPCRIEAGYASGTSLVWLGDLRTVQTVRDGPDWVTQLSSGDGEKAWQNARLHVSYGPKTSIDTALRAIVRALGVGEGNLSKVVSKLQQAGSAIYPIGCVVSAAASRQLTDFARSAQLEVTVQDGALQFTDIGAAIGGQALRLTRDTGLVDSPTVDNNGLLTARMLMIPDVRIGALVTVDAERIKGTYRIQKAVWSGDTAATNWFIDFQAQRY